MKNLWYIVKQKFKKVKFLYPSTSIQILVLSRKIVGISIPRFQIKSLCVRSYLNNFKIVSTFFKNYIGFK